MTVKGSTTTQASDPAHQEELSSLVASLIAIPSVTPWIDPGSAGEGQVAAAIIEWFDAVDGVEVTCEDAAPGRPNVLVRLPGTGGGKNLCISVHTDTVTAAPWPDRAFTATRKGDRLIGLGACDNKGQVAALMFAIRALAASDVRAAGDVVAAFVADEEGQSLGTHALVAAHRFDAAIVLEPIGNGKCCITHQGFGSLDLIVKGGAAHGLDADVAVDAIVETASIIGELALLDAQQFAPAPHPLNGKTMFHTSKIAAGTDYGTYASECVLGFEMGTQPGETLADRVAEVEAAIERVRERYPKLDARVEVRLDNDPFVAAGHDELLQAYSAATRQVTQRQLQESGWGPWADSAITQAAGIPTILVGAAGGNLHAADEWTSIPELSQLIEILRDCAQRFCGPCQPHHD